jgi:hypothetical protein
LKTTWLVLEAADVEANTVLDEVELTAAGGTFNFSLENGGSLWPPGRYRVDLFMDDEMQGSFEYSIEQTVFPEIQELSLARDAVGNDPTTVFQSDETFHLVGSLLNSAGGTKVKVIWSAIAVEGGSPQGVIDEQEQELGSGEFSFAFDSALPAWPVGSYSVDVFLDGSLVQTLEFQVEGVPEVTAEDVRTALDEDGVNQTSVFGPQDKFYLVAEIKNVPPEGSAVKVVWTSLHVEGDTADNYEINTYEGSLENGTFWASLTNNSDTWPVGQYRVDLYLAGEFVQSVDFEVSAEGASPVSGAAASLEGLYIARDSDGEHGTNVFLPEETFYLVGELVNSPQAGQVEAIWIAEDAPDFDPGEVISEEEIFDFDEGLWSISLAPESGGWAPGQYKVDIHLNGSYVETRYFLVTTTRIVDPFMALDQDGAQKTSTFSAGNPFHVIFDLAAAPTGTVVSSRWIQLGETAEEDITLDESDFDFQTGSYYIKLPQPEGGWTTGDYLVDLYLNEYFYTTLYFEVQ